MHTQKQQTAPWIPGKDFQSQVFRCNLCSYLLRFRLHDAFNQLRLQWVGEDKAVSSELRVVSGHKDFFLHIPGTCLWKSVKILVMYINWFQFSSVAHSCLTLCDPMDCSMPGLPVHHQLPESTQTHVHWVGDAIQPCHLLVVPFFSCPQPFKWVSSSHQVAKILEFQLQHQFFQWTPRTDLL